MTTSLAAALVVGAYLLGSVPVGLIVARAVKGVDVRRAGSGNIGATNVGRVIGRKWGLLVWLLDVMKGFLPVLAASRLANPLYPWGAADSAVPLPAALCGLAAVCGHNFPVFLRFRGGKGVSTSCGVLLYLFPWGLLAGAATWAAVVAFTRYVSVGSMLAGAALTVAALLVPPDPFGRSQYLTLLCAALAALIVARHRSNIQRLRNGTEHRVGRRGSQRSGDHSSS